jgi:hypothetical protein
MLADARSGKVTGFVFAAIGPEFAQWWNGYMSSRMDRLTLLGQLSMLQRAIQDEEMKS